jgi:hypothetical protein
MFQKSGFSGRRCLSEEAFVVPLSAEIPPKGGTTNRPYHTWIGSAAPAAAEHRIPALCRTKTCVNHFREGVARMLMRQIVGLQGNLLE